MTAVAPTPKVSIAGATANQPVTDTATTHPFARVTVTDTSAGQTETVTITQDTAANGVLTDPNAAADGCSVSGNVMTLSGTAVQVSTELEALVFTPTAHQAAPGSTVTTGFTLGVTDTAGVTASDSTISVVATAVETPPAIGGTQAGQATTDQQALHPFAAAMVTDPDLGASETAGITLSNGGAGGTLAGAGLTTTGGGIYTLAAANPAGLTVSNEGFYLNLHTTVAPSDGPGSVQGLLGSLTGQANDLALPDGTMLAQPVPDADLLGQFASACSVGAGSMLDGGGPAMSPASLGLPATPSFVTATAPGEVLTGSLGQASASGVIIQGSLSDLSGAVIANFASRDAIDLTGAALPATDFRYAPAAPAAS